MPEALEELKVLTANSSADYGNVNGAGIVAVLKSGTNQFHGSAFGFLQSNKVDAIQWGSPTAAQTYTQTQFGGTFGGPIIKNKLFFFGDYLGARHHTGGTKSDSVLTSLMRQGDFSELNSIGVQLYDPENNFAPYANNQGVPINNPVAKYLFAHSNLYPEPNATPLAGTVTGSNYVGPYRSYNANDQGDIKIEYNPRAKDKITGFYSMSTAYDGNTPVLPTQFISLNNFPTKVMGSNWVHTFTSNLINSARIGYTRVVWSQGLPQDQTGAFGTNGDSIVGITYSNQAYEGFTSQVFQNASIGTMGNQASNNNSLVDNTYSYSDNVVWQKGRHSISLGGSLIRYQNNYPTSNNYGYLGQETYTGVFSSNPNASDGGGYAGADFVLDRVAAAAATLGAINVGQRQFRSAGFINDDFKLLQRLTLNFGLRYEYDQPWFESNNKTANIDIDTGQVLYARSVPTSGQVAPGSGVCSNHSCYNANFRQIVPRIGFAYQIGNRWVVRGGYGATSFFEGNSSNQRLTSSTPFIKAVNATTLAPTTTSGGTPRTAEEGFTNASISTGNGLSSNATYQVWPKNIQPAYVQEWNLTTEYAITPSLSLQVGYVGESGQHVEDYGNLNQFLTNGDPTTARYYNNQYIGVSNTTSGTAVGSNVLMITESRAMMNYNALQAVLRQRTHKGLEFTVNYTYSKSMTNSFGNYALNVNGFAGGFQNYYNSQADYGPAGSDLKHNLSATAVYELPFGRGKHFLPNSNRILDEVIGGWKLSTALIAYSGFAETVITNQGNGSNEGGYGASRPNQYGKLKIVNRSLSHWFGTDASAQPCLASGNSPDQTTNPYCAFGNPLANTFGTAGNGNVRGPGYFNDDLSLFKDFNTYKQQTIGFRFDAFNAFNIVSYGNPDTNISDGEKFGLVSNARSQERRLQFSAHYRF